MKMYLMSKGLWGAVFGEERVTETKEQQAHAEIVLTLSDSQLMHVINAATFDGCVGKVGEAPRHARHGK